MAPNLLDAPPNRRPPTNLLIRELMMDPLCCHSRVGRKCEQTTSELLRNREGPPNRQVRRWEFPFVTAGCAASQLGVRLREVKTFRAEVTQEGERWILRVPSLDNHTEKGERLIDAEQRLREVIASKFHMEQGDICLELQDGRGTARERPRRLVPPDVSTHPAIGT